VTRARRSTSGTGRRAPRTVQEAIARAEAVLPGVKARDGDFDPRWDAIENLARFVDSEPDAVWAFAAKWGCHRSVDLRAAIGVILIEDLVQAHFDLVFPRLVAKVRENERFAGAAATIYNSGLDPGRAARLGRLLDEAWRRADRMRRKARLRRARGPAE
jgi:hypothetical protein